MFICVYDRGSGRLVTRISLEDAVQRIVENRGMSAKHSIETQTEMKMQASRELQGGLHITTAGYLYCKDELPDGEEF